MIFNTDENDNRMLQYPDWYLLYLVYSINLLSIQTKNE